MDDDVIAFVYDADCHCSRCACERFGESINDTATEDSEGNPIVIITTWDAYPASGIYCSDCGNEIIPRVQVTVQTRFERDNAQVSVFVGRAGDANDELVCEWLDEEVAEAVEDGFLDPRDYTASAIAYAESMGLLTWGGETVEA